jgi:hypothetical protein
VPELLFVRPIVCLPARLQVNKMNADVMEFFNNKIMDTMPFRWLTANRAPRFRSVWLS